ncbi:MAG: ABC transporter ATP-binding protein [Chloroflexota bacterium]
MSSIRKISYFLKPYWHWAVLAPLMMLFEVVMDLLQPRLVQRIVDEGIAHLDMHVVIQTGLWMVVVAFGGAVGGVGCTIFAMLASQGFGADLRSAMFRKVQSLSFGNLDELETGQIITRLTNDVTQVQEVVAMLLRIMVRAPLTLIGSLIMAFLTSPRLSLIFLAVSPFVGFLVWWVIGRAYPMFGRVQRRLDDLNSVLQENLAGIRVVKAFARADYEVGRFGRVNDNLMDETIRAARVLAVTSPGMMVAVNLGVVAAIWFGGVQITQGGMQTGQLIAFITYLMRALGSLMMVSMLLMRLARAQASADRIQEVMESVPKIRPPVSAHQGIAGRGRITFEGVTFSYGDGKDPVLKNINLTAEPGQRVAILGATGAGKSSLIHLIPRFYDVSAGRICLDGVDVRQIDEAALRRSIGVALQEAILFSGTIRDNIRYGRPDAADEDVVAAAKAAQAHDFIQGFPQGYDTLVGQRGVNLSGGQKQRLAIARALLTRPTVLILDDSTSAVDVETESRIEQALETCLNGSTRLVIAQRISTVLNADKIVVLEDGAIAAEGRHADLLASSPIYREIYDSQLGNGH